MTDKGTERGGVELIACMYDPIWPVKCCLLRCPHAQVVSSFEMAVNLYAL